MDASITGTISRTIITHGCTQMMVLSIFFFGGATLHYFALALTIGICFGIYSSVLVAVPAREVPRRLARGLREAGEEGRSWREIALSGAARRPSSTSSFTSTSTSPRWSSEYGVWVYAILFAIIFAETGLRGDAVPARAIRCSSWRARSPPWAASTSTCSSSLLIVAADARQHRQLRHRPLAREDLLHATAARAGSIPSTSSARTPSTRSTAAWRW